MRSTARDHKPPPTPPTGKMQFGYRFPAIRGVQAGREHFVSMCPLKLIPKLFMFNEDELVAELRAQRLLNRGRVPEIARYIVENPTGYVFSSLTASVDGELRFEAMGEAGDALKIGILYIPMEARFVINDGQHRKAAIEMALRDNPDLGDEHISVVFFHDIGLDRCQQMFADLNRHAIRPSTSLGVLYDNRDVSAGRTKLAVLSVPLFRDLTEKERNTLSARSRKLFTLSALYHATSTLVKGIADTSSDELQQIAIDFWKVVADQFPDWDRVFRRELSAADVRRDFLHTSGVVLHAIGCVGNWLLRNRREEWRESLSKLSKIDWSRDNSADWEGRALTGGKVGKSRQNILMTTIFIKTKLGIPLSPEERAADRLRGKAHRG